MSSTLYKAFVEIGYKGFDKVDKYMTGAVESVKKGVGTMTNSLGALNEIVGSASPLAVNTFNGSLEILKARLGQQLTPYVLQASKALQDLDKWFKELNPETKKAIANWIMAGTAAAGVFAVIAAGIPILKALMANPIALIFAAASVAVIKLTQDMDAMNKKMGESIDKMERMRKGVFTAKEFAGSSAEAIVNDKDMTKEQKIAKAKEIKEQLTAQARQLNADNANDTFAKQAATTGGKAWGYITGQESGTERDAKKVGELMAEIGLLTDSIKKLEEGKDIKFTDEKDLPKKKTDPNNRLKLAGMQGMGGGAGASIGNLDSAYNKLNLQALGGNELQRELLKIQQESLKEVQEQSQDVSSIAETLQKAVGL